MTGLHPRGDQLEHTGVYTCADGKAESVYLAAGCPWVPRRSGLYIELSARATMAVSAIFWTTEAARCDNYHIGIVEWFAQARPIHPGSLKTRGLSHTAVSRPRSGQPTASDKHRLR